LLHSTDMKKPKIITIVGPTSSGKTSLSIEIAKQCNGEIISADSRQVYRNMDIGTGKVTEAEMAGIPHYLLDVADPTEIYTAKQFVDQAEVAIQQIHSRSYVPIIAGGTFFYVDLLRGKMTVSPVEPDNGFRDSLEKYSNAELLELLEQKDSRRASTIDVHNRRRLIRSLEIIHTLGSVPEPQPVTTPYEWLVLGIATEKEELQQKMRIRLDEWLGRGLLEEVADIRELVSPARFLEFGFEYTLTADYIDQTITKEQFVQKFIEKNWQYAKRQMTWLKKDKEIQWLQPESLSEALTKVEAFLAE